MRAELPALLRYATALCGDSELARDLVQDVLARAYVRWASIQATTRPAAYLMRMTTNEFLGWRRRWSTRTFLPSDSGTLDRIGAVVPDPAAGVIERRALEARLARLPRRQQAALVLRYYEGLDYGEAAAVLGCAEGTVRSLCSRALAALRVESEQGELLLPLFHRESS